MKTLFVLSLISLSSSAMAQGLVPAGECQLEGQRKYVTVAQGVDEVYVCQSGVWEYLFTRNASGNQD